MVMAVGTVGETKEGSTVAMLDVIWSVMVTLPSSVLGQPSALVTCTA